MAMSTTFSHGNGLLKDSQDWVALVREVAAGGVDYVELASTAPRHVLLGRWGADAQMWARVAQYIRSAAQAFVSSSLDASYLFLEVRARIGTKLLRSRGIAVHREAGAAVRLVKLTEAEARSILRWVSRPEVAGLQSINDDSRLATKMQEAIDSFEDERELSGEEMELVRKHRAHQATGKGT